MNTIAFPFLTLGKDAIDAGSWETVLGGDRTIALGTYLKDWDYQRHIRIRRTLKLNRDIAAKSLGISPSEIESLKAIVRMGTGPGTKPRNWIDAICFDFDTDNNYFYIDHEVSGELLSTRLQLNTAVVLDTPFKNPGPLSPTLESARVWTDEIDIKLEGQEPRFPVETISFNSQFASKQHIGATWYLHWNPKRIDGDFAGTVRLFLNRDNELFMERFTSADELTLQSVMAGVMIQMVGSFVAQTDLHDHISDCDPGSVGHMINHWMQTAFPGESISAISSRLESRPSDFHACILAAAELRGD